VYTTSSTNVTKLPTDRRTDTVPWRRPRYAQRRVAKIPTQIKVATEKLKTVAV